MKIELKKIKISEHMSEETTAFTAEIYINGVNAGYAKNDGHGGNTDYRSHYDEDKRKNDLNRELIAMAERHCLSLPPIKYSSPFSKSGIGTMEMNLENFIDELISAELKKKDEAKLNKKIQKLCEKALVYGLKGGDSYRIMDFKRPLKDIAFTNVGKETIQRHYDVAKAGLKKGEVFFNTNLKELGIKL